MRLFKNSLLISILIFLMVIFQGCPFGDEACDSTIYIENNSDKILYVCINDVKEITFVDVSSSPLFPHSQKTSCDMWKKRFDKGRSITFHLFFFDKAVVDTVPWDTIRVHNMYLKRIDFTRATLDSLHWTLTYP